MAKAAYEEHIIRVEYLKINLSASKSYTTPVRTQCTSGVTALLAENSSDFSILCMSEHKRILIKRDGYAGVYYLFENHRENAYTYYLVRYTDRLLLENYITEVALNIDVVLVEFCAEFIRVNAQFEIIFFHK